MHTIEKIGITTIIIKLKFLILSLSALLVIFSISSLSFANNHNQLKTLNGKELIDAKQNGAIIIDIRRSEEWLDTGIIEGAKLITAFQKDGSIHPEFNNKFNSIIISDEMPIVLYCRTGNRTNLLGNALINQLGFKNISHLSYGIEGWRKDGFNTIDYHHKMIVLGRNQNTP